MDIAFSDYLRFMLALAFVLGLILGAALLAKRFGIGNQAPMRLRGQKRLAIVESMALDTKHRLLLVRRDQTEHLIVIGGMSDLVIETGIVAHPTSEASSTMPVEAQP
jgi:flagellar protein FliO/FliZ